MKPRYVSVIGGGCCRAAEYALAEEVGRLVAETGATLVCGGLAGVMEGAAKGAKRAGGTTIGILPGHDRHAANPHLDHVITTGMGEARNLAVVSSGDAVIAVAGGFGTLSEIGLAAKIGRPVIIIRGWHVESDEPNDGLWYASSAEEAFALLAKLPGQPSGGSKNCQESH